MSQLTQNIANLALDIATDIKALRTQIDGNANSLMGLNTTAKGNLVAALNELKGLLDQAQLRTDVDDNLSGSAAKTWSINKIKDQISAAVAAVVGNAPAALDTLSEIAAKLSSEDSAINALILALDSRVRFDAPQTMTSAQRAQARSNIDAYGPVELGDPNTDFVALFRQGLV